MPSPAPDPDRRSGRARDAILAATRARLLDVGFDRLTIEGIATAAGVGKQTIYRWWPSKGAVVFDAILAATTSDGGSRDLPDTGDLARDLRDVMRAIVAELGDPATDRMQRTMLAAIQHDPVLAQELVTRLLGPQMTAVAARLETARAAGQIRPEIDVPVAVDQLIGPVFHRWSLRTAPLDEGYADRLVGQVLAGLSPD